TAYRELANASGQFLPLGIIVSLFYLAMSLPMGHVARRLERRLKDRSERRVEGTDAKAEARSAAMEFASNVATTKSFAGSHSKLRPKPYWESLEAQVVAKRPYCAVSMVWN